MLFNLGVFHKEDITYSVKASSHSLDRMKEYDISRKVVFNTVKELPAKALKQYSNDEIAILNFNQNISVIAFVPAKTNKIRIITVINKYNIWTKKDTKIEKLY
ncbi:MAG: hypothetical protein ACOCP8_08200 [archaeon]